jgi:predicted DNA-binding WGR domain protein
MRAYLERVDRVAGSARFYVVLVAPTLLGDWVMTKEWGRIGQGGTVRERAYPTRAEAEAAAQATVAGKERRGYRRRGV